MHRRCQAVYMSDDCDPLLSSLVVDCDPLLSSLVVVDCAWFMRTIDAATSEAARCPGAILDASKLYHVRRLIHKNDPKRSTQFHSTDKQTRQTILPADLLARPGTDEMTQEQYEHTGGKSEPERPSRTLDLVVS